MSSYVVLARKWRPAQFLDIVGQTHIVRTLTNAIHTQKTHHAYLFSGSRGVGKTSIARIFAKYLRCQNLEDLQTTLRSCDTCQNCKEISNGTSVDVIEIDGASNNGVEAVREIREHVKYMPAHGERKIYIIDEVHMLTTAAFNALLKTIEEPPPHVIFMFATTEPHKVPSTIISRCQRLEYHRVTAKQIQGRLSEICVKEGVQFESGALSLIARAAEGSMRDALSLLDQVIAYANSPLSLQMVRESIGLIAGQTLIQTLKAVFQRDPLQAIQIVGQVFEQGHDLKIFAKNLIEVLHASLLAKVGSTQSPISELSEEEWAEIKEISLLRPIEEIEMIFQVFQQGQEWLTKSPQPKIILDILLIKCAAAEALVYLDSSSQKPIEKQIPVEVKKDDLNSLNSASSLQTHDVKKIEGVKNSEKSWGGFIEVVRKTRPLLASILEHSIGTDLPFVYFSSQDAYFKEQLQAKLYQDQLSSLSEEYFGKRFRFQIEIKDAGESMIAKKDREKKERNESIKDRAQQHPIILEAKSLFGGELGPIIISENPHAG